LGEEQLHLVEDLGTILHSVLICNEPVCKRLVKLGSIPTIEELHSLAFQSYTPIHRFMHYLSYGATLQSQEYAEEQKDQAHVSWLRLQATSFMLAVVTSNVRSSTGGVIKQLIGAILIAACVSVNVFDALSEFGLCPSWRMGRRDSLSRFALAMSKGCQTVSASQNGYYAFSCLTILDTSMVVAQILLVIYKWCCSCG
jgi:hypothetical protein